MGIDRIPECPGCPEKLKRPQDCPKESWKCPGEMRGSINDHLTTVFSRLEEEKTRGASLAQMVGIYAEEIASVESTLKKQGCTLFTRLLQRHFEIDYCHRVQKGIRQVDLLRAASKAASHSRVYP